MTIERFGLNSGISPDGLILIENYGLAVYAAQSFERGLQNVLTGLERLGEFTLPPRIDRSREGFVDECLGPMLRILESQARMDNKMSRVLRKAHYQRNELVHHFLMDNAVDMLNAAGRASINDKLRRIYQDIRHAEWIVLQLAEKIFAQLGVAPDQVDKQIAELLRLSDDTVDE